MYMHTYTQTYIYTCTYTCTYTRIHAHTYTYACICTRMHRSKILVTTPQRVQAISQTHIRIHMHMHAYTHIYIYTHMCTTCSECVRKCYVGVKSHPCNAHTCPCTSAQNTFSKVHATLTAKKCTYVYTHTHMHTHTYTRASITPSTR